MGEFHNAVVDGAGAMTTAGRELQSQMGAGIVVAGAVAATGFQVHRIFSLPRLPFPPPLSTGNSSLHSLHVQLNPFPAHCSFPHIFSIPWCPP